MTYGRLYLISNKINGKIYIGQTVRSIKSRFQEHLAQAMRGYTSCPHLYEALRKYGSEAFKVDQIFEANSEGELNRFEAILIKVSKSTNKSIGYNITPGGIGSKQTPETRAKISRSMKGRVSLFLGKKHTEETKKKISETKHNRIIRNKDTPKWVNALEPQ